METKINSNRLEAIIRRMGYYGGFLVDVMGRKGGLTLIWKHET